MKKTYFFLSLLTLALVSSCQNRDELINETSRQEEVHDKTVNVTHHDGRPFSTGKDSGSTNGKFVAGPGGGVLMQGFYWDVPEGGNWWNTVKDKLTAWSDAGIGAVWLPPASKAQNGAYSMGYDPTDYYDFGNFNQNGSTETRFGSRTELEALITKAHSENMQVYADIVINHNSGGQSEYNPYVGSNTWTNFSGVASGKFTRNYRSTAIKLSYCSHF